jgi:dTMP kinase
VAPLFVTFEGGEGTGKSTHARRLAERLVERVRATLLKREPGGSPGAEEVRALLVTGGPDRWSATAEALLNYAARDAHLREAIKPALARGDIVVCDRFIDSTRVYQGVAGGCDMALLDELERHVVGADRPTLTLILDVDAEQGLARAEGRAHSGENRFERKGLDYHRRLREGFLEIARRETERCRLIDSGRQRDEVADEIWRTVAPLAGLA